jgi:FkbM family methyltransferase
MINFKALIKQGIKRFVVIDVFLRQILLRNSANRPFSLTKFGFKFRGHAQMQGGIFEPTETQIIRNLLPLFDRFVNIGANIGYYCCHAAQLGVRGIAFEPSTRNLNLLLENLQANSWGDRCEIFPIALSDKIGILKLYGDGTGASLVPGWNSCSTSYYSLVPVSNLDTVLPKEEGGLYLVDIEGFEYQMLLGAKQHLTPDSVWIVEISIAEHLPDGQLINRNVIQTFDIFWRNGFKSYTCEFAPREITRQIIEKLITEKNTNTIGVHNFIFVGSKSSLDVLSRLNIN